MKGQPAIEFLTTYSWAFLILAVFIVAAIAMISVKSPLSYVQSSCYISPELFCYYSSLLSNATSSMFVIQFSNNMGTSIYLGGNSITLLPNAPSSKRFTGQCIPQGAPPGAVVICTVALPYPVQPDIRAESAFTLSYKICDPACSGQYNTSGSSLQSTSGYKRLLNPVTFMATPNGAGNVIVDGVRYPSNTAIYLLSGVQYTIYGLPPKGQNFINWFYTSGIIVSNTLSQTATAAASAGGTITANFT